MESASGWNAHLDEAWLAQVQESVLDPEIPVVDPHHHLWAKPFSYEVPELLQDLQSGHRVVATVYTEAGRGYRSDGPEHLKPVGETEMITSIAEAADRANNGVRICAGITGSAELASDLAQLDEVLDAHIAAGRGRFSGIRANIFVTFHPTTLAMIPLPGWEDAADRPDFLAGVGLLGRKGLALDLVCTHAHFDQVVRLARKVPDATLVLNHLAPIVDFGEQPTSESELLAAWRRGVTSLAPFPNVHMKLGGCGNPMMARSLSGFRSLRQQPKPPTSEQLAEIYRPLISHAIETIGPSRCMFESNFPVDKWYTSYRVLWNAFKRLTHSYSDDERRALLGRTAATVYHLKHSDLSAG